MSPVNVIPVGKVVEWLISIALHLWQLLATARDVLHLTCRPARGVYRETHSTPRGKLLPDKSIIVVKPRFAFFGLKLGISIEGVCYRHHQELRKFESQKVVVRTKNPVTVDYSYLAYAKGIPFYNNGYIRFGDKEDGMYMQADGYFDLPDSIYPSEHPRNAQIHFHWQRIPPEELRAKTGKRVLKSTGDIRHFLHTDGEL